MATVYLAHDLKHDRDVAIKVLHPDLGAALGGERFLTRDPHHGAAAAPAHPAAARQRRRRRPALLRDAARHRRDAARPARSRAPAAGRRRRCCIAREVADALGYAHAPGRHPPRHQAREHPAAGWARAGRRLRHRARRADRRRPADDADRPLARHAAVHEPRAGDGRTHHRRAQRHLRARCGDVRNAGRRSAVHRTERAGDRRPGHDGGAPVGHPAAQGGARAVEDAVLSALEKLPGRSVRDRSRVRGGARRRGYRGATHQRATNRWPAPGGPSGPCRGPVASRRSRGRRRTLGLAPSRTRADRVAPHHGPAQRTGARTGSARHPHRDHPRRIDARLCRWRLARLAALGQAARRPRATPVPGSEGAYDPFFAPDGRELGS